MLIIDFLPTVDGYRLVVDEDKNDQIIERIRLWRNKQLLATDWTQLADAPVDKVAWATYRQELRDLPSSNADALKIVLPNKPTGGN